MNNHSQAKPDETLLHHSAATLSNDELLALILRDSTSSENALHLARHILARYGDLHALNQAAPADFQQIEGLDSASITRLHAALELGRRLMAHQPNHHPVINRAADAVQLVRDMHHLPQEHVRVILLDNNQRALSVVTVYIGTLNASLLRVSEVFREAVVRNCPAIILVHNHPSGDSAPSPEDIEITRTLITAGQYLDIVLFDHLIIGHHSWSSLKEMGLSF